MKVGIVMGSSSDLEVAKKVAKTLTFFEIEWEMEVISAHRTPDRAIDYAKDAKKHGIGVIVALAGKAAHLGGVIAACTNIPVIGIPIKTSMMGGLDSLLSMVQMPKGVPVATVAVDGGENAAILAAQILGLNNSEIEIKLAKHKEKLKEDVELMNKEVENFKGDLS
ncbi:MAG: 5-(carboxyamino)imidazole ribonucleotide mutase [Tissierellia bacterium]|nr:5-(carboxyamino)imidazole ribonucleotide mutase [Tissierellia bacterium]